ncbi:hypothetical protein T08_11890 [Trichinella sp. T8]|nr:hypothetical protein T08_11890 [Trichinella sp. T8]
MVEFWHRKFFRHYNEIAGIISLPIAQIKIAKYLTFLPISHQIRFCTTNTFWKVLRQINAYVSYK